MKRLARFWWIAPLLLSACAKTTPVTQVLAVVQSDLEVGTELTKVRVRISDPDSPGSGNDLPFQLVAKDPDVGEFTLPLSFGIVPKEGQSEGRFLLQVSGYGPLGPNGSEIEVVRENVLTGFAPDRSAIVYVFLGSTCLKTLCDAEDGPALQHCDYRSGQCDDVDYVPPVPADVHDPMAPLTCPDGFELDGTSCADIDECANGSAECSEDASCENTQGAYACACADGSHVEPKVDCTDQGSTSSPGDSGIRGDSGTPGVDPCASNPCQSPGACDPDGDSFRCSCPSGYASPAAGETECVDIDECKDGSAGCKTDSCTNTKGSFQCTGCPAGFADPAEGDTTCIDVDECKLGTAGCPPMTDCANTTGTFQCSGCPAGFTDPAAGDTACIDIDECELGTAGCATSSCANTTGSFQCSGCPAGFTDPAEGETACVDIDECALDTDGCDPLATCNNTSGSFLCDCPSGYVDPAAGVTACVLIPPVGATCATNNGDCDPAASCNDGSGSVVCTCPEWTVDVNTNGTSCRSCVAYVKSNGSDGQDGSSWAKAKQTISAALAVTDVCEVWTAAGTYLPTRDSAGSTTPADPREKTFALVTGVELHGGFAGTETRREQRQPFANPTILSGDLGVAQTTTDNAYHVLRGATDAVVSGFFVIGGLATGTAPELRNQGSGMINDAVLRQRIEQMVFVANTAGYGGGLISRNGASVAVESSAFLWNAGGAAGGGVAASSSSATVTSSTFFQNSGGYGVGAWAYTANLTLRDCTFQGQSANQSGAVDLATASLSANGHALYNVTFVGNTGPKGSALWMDGASPTVTGCTFIGNSSTSNQGAAVTTYTQQGNAAPHLSNCAFWNNTNVGPEIDLTPNNATPTIDHSCAQQDLSPLGSNNVTITSTPLASTLPSALVYLDQTKTTPPTCIDAGSNSNATAASILWPSLTTAANGALDTTTVDAGRHVSPLAVAISALSTNATTLTWTTKNATACVWIDEALHAVHQATPGTTMNAAHGSASGVRLALICTGNVGEPAVAGVTVP